MTGRKAPDPVPLASNGGREVVIAVLLAAEQHEADSHGAGRRSAFRTTRYLIEGATRAGLPARVIADALGVRPDTLRTRRGQDGLIDPLLFVELAGIAESDIAQWRREGQIVLTGPDRSGTIGYRASEIIAAFVRRTLLNGPVGTDAEALSAAELHRPRRDEPATTGDVAVGPQTTRLLHRAPDDAAR